MLFNRLIQQFSLINFRFSNCQIWHIGFVVTILSTPFIFSTVSEAQLSPKLKASESEGKIRVSSMNRAQQAYYAENTGFTSSVANLGLGVKPENANYKYSIGTGNKAVFNYGVSQQANFRSFVGGVFLIGTTTKTILCQTNAASTTKPANPINQNGTLVCGVNTTPVR